MKIVSVTTFDKMCLGLDIGTSFLLVGQKHHATAQVTSELDVLPVTIVTEAITLD